MKLRNDFVSNSSSCSFTIKQVYPAVELFDSLGRLGYSVDGIDIEVGCSKKDYKLLYQYFNSSTPSSTYYDINYSHDVGFSVSGGFDHFIDMWTCANEDIKAKIKSFSITCDDYKEYEMTILKLLYVLCDLSNLNPSSEYSEISFDPKANDCFMNNLISKIEQLKETAKCQKHSKTK